MGRYTPSDESTGGGNYLKLKALDNGPIKLRVMSEPVTGYECWTKENKPMRRDSLAALLEAKPNGGWRVENGEEDRPKFFVAFFIWNHNDKAVQVAMFPQKTVRQQLDALEENEDWGKLTGYDLTISRVKAGDKVTYTIQPSPAKPLPKDAVAAWAEVDGQAVGLAALFNDGNPFQPFSESVPF